MAFYPWKLFSLFFFIISPSTFNIYWINYSVAITLHTFVNIWKNRMIEIVTIASLFNKEANIFHACLIWIYKVLNKKTIVYKMVLIIRWKKYSINIFWYLNKIKEKHRGSFLEYNKKLRGSRNLSFEIFRENKIWICYDWSRKINKMDKLCSWSRQKW
jgi:hypothetical protein